MQRGLLHSILVDIDAEVIILIIEAHNFLLCFAFFFSNAAYLNIAALKIAQLKFRDFI